MLPVDEALSRVLAAVGPLPAESVPLMDALGRVLAEDVRAETDLPPFSNSAMDGYAVVAADTRSATDAAPVSLAVVGDVPAGRVADRPVAPGSAMRIMTGAPLPDGADAVVMVEHTERRGDRVAVRQGVEPGENVRPQGEEVRRGELLLAPGAALGPAHLGVCATAGLARVRVGGRPSVAVLTTGDEVVEPGGPLPPGKIRNANLAALAGQVIEAGALLHSAAHVGDDPAALRAALEAASAADVVVTSGGVSVGDFDFVKDVLGGMGRVEFWRVAMKPGKPLTFGTLRAKPIFGLPGNPVSSMVTFEIFVRPALRKMMGRLDLQRPTVTATLQDAIQHRPGRREFVRAVTTPGESGWEARTTGAQGSGMITSVARANSFIIVPEDQADVPPGARIQVMLLG